MVPDDGSESIRRNKNLLERVLAPGNENLTSPDIENLASAVRNSGFVSVALSGGQVPLHVAGHPVEKLDCGN